MKNRISNVVNWVLVGVLIAYVIAVILIGRELIMAIHISPIDPWKSWRERLELGAYTAILGFFGMAFLTHFVSWIGVALGTLPKENRK